ncbi:MAG: pyroglutamyl-peptidase I [Candidatus Izemoplasmataceae bacterium]|jgi:pyroglutamyl-peptidase
MKPMDTVLITAFEAFGDDQINPTERILAELPDFLYNAKIVKVTLPVVYNQVFDELKPLIEKHQPKVILMLGLAAGRTHINIERVAINISDSKSPDNKGNILRNVKINKEGQAGYFTTLPLDNIMLRLKKKGIPAQISNSAGAYVCNHIMYHVLHHIKTEKMETFAGFIHVPYLPEQVLEKPGVASLDLQIMIDSILTIIDELINPVKLV